MVLSLRADARSCPNGFSMTTRRQASPLDEANPDRSSCWQTVEKNDGGMDR